MRHTSKQPRLVLPAVQLADRRRPVPLVPQASSFSKACAMPAALNDMSAILKQLDVCAAHTTA